MSENFIIQDLSERKYFSMIPYLIHEIGLDVYEIAVYCAIKRSAGDDGNCIKSKKTLATQSGNISTRKLVDVIHSLCQINKILKKPLIMCQQRPHEYGDSDTNLLKIVDIWIENVALCRENERQKAKTTPGGAQYAPPNAHNSPPHAQYAPGGVHAMQGGGAQYAPKEEPIKKNPLKKTTTPTPFREKVAEEVVVKSKKNKEAQKEAAKSMKKWLDQEAIKKRKRKIRNGKLGSYFEETEWGDLWILPVELFEALIDIYGIAYFQDQLNHMVREQNLHDQAKKTRGVDIPETFLKLACERNYALSTNLKGE